MEDLTPATIDQFRDWLIRTGKSRNTARVYGSDLELFRQWAAAKSGARLLASITVDDLAEISMDWLTSHYESGEWAAKTVRRRLTALRTWARWAGWSVSWLSEYKTPVPAKPRPHPLPNGMADVEEMLDAVSGDKTKSALIALCGYMGLRVGEALGVRAGHVDLSSGWLDVKLGKGKRERGVPIPTKATPHLERACAGQPSEGRIINVTDRTARRWITAAGVAAGVSRPVSSHDLRATAGTHWYRMTKDLRTTQELMGHSDSRTTEIYTGISDGAMREAINK